MDQKDAKRRERMGNKETWREQFSPVANAHRVPGAFTQVQENGGSHVRGLLFSERRCDHAIFHRDRWWRQRRDLEVKIEKALEP